MTQRKPPGVSFETWIDKQIQDATSRGEFDNLPGAGKPIPGLGKRHDDMWWISQKMRKENLSWLPPTLALRKKAEDALDAARKAKSEIQVRQIITEINDEIRDAIRKPAAPGPPLNLMPYDVDAVVAEWRQRRDEMAANVPEPVPETTPAPPQRTRWWRRHR